MSDDGPGAREVAHRVFAAEFDDASLSYSESDEERAPNYVVTPTGARVNRLFVAGVLTEVERVNDETRRGRVVDPSGAFVTYAGQYQPEAQAFLERADPPSFVALTGKARTFEPEDSDRVFTSVRPESLNDVDADTRDRWVVSAAEATLDRLAVFAEALDSELRGDELRAALETGGAPAPLAAGIPKAIAHYDTSTAYVEAVRRLAVDALELIAGDRDEVRALDLAPDAGGDAAVGALPETDVTIEAPTGAAAPSEGAEATADVEAEATADVEAEATADVEAEATADAETAAVDAGGTSDSIESSATAESDGSETTETAESAATDDTAAESTAATDEEGGLGDFETGGDDLDTDEETIDTDEETIDADDGTDETAASADPAGDEMYELDDEEREEIESEFGTDFATGSEVDDPGEADIDVPDPEDLQETPQDAAATDLDADAGETADASDESDGSDAADDSDDDADVDIEAAAVDAMAALDDGDGADREAVVDRVVAEHGVAADAVEDAIQDALMSGKCYEPGDGVLKPI
jgi:RPA family protein